MAKMEASMSGGQRNTNSAGLITDNSANVESRSLINPDTVDALLEGVSTTAEKVLPVYERNYENYLSLARASNNQAAALAWQAFENPNAAEAAVLRAQQNWVGRMGDYYNGLAEDLSPRIRFWGSPLTANLDRIGTGLTVVTSVVDVATAPTASEAARRAFVDTAGIYGARIGTFAGGILAGVEEGETLGLATPVAVATVMAGNLTGAYLAENFAARVYDFGEAGEERITTWYRGWRN